MSTQVEKLIPRAVAVSPALMLFIVVQGGRVSPALHNVDLQNPGALETSRAHLTVRRDPAKLTKMLVV